MTVESQTISEDLLPSSEVETAVPTSTHGGPYLRVALGFLVISSLLGLLAGLELLVPELFAGVGPLSYGRLYPIAVNMFVYGWLTIGLAGALLHVVSRTGRVDAKGVGFLSASLGLLALGVVAGSVGIAVGASEGRQYLEYPLWADVLILAGIVGVAGTISSMVRRATHDGGPVRWYAIAATWWLALAFAVGNVPGVSGVAGAFQTSFFRASLIGLWLAAAGVAVVYYVIPQLAGRGAFVPTRLSVLGFWSLAFLWALTAPANLTYSPAPDWLETLGVLLSLGLLIPPAVIFADLVLAMRRRWEVSSGSMTLRFVVLGGILFALWPVANLALAFRASSGLLQFTDWVRGVEVLALQGVFTAWLAAFIYLAAPELFGGGVRTRLSRLHYFGTVLGLAVWVGSSLLAGLTAGWTWVASANEVGVSAAGVGFSNTLAGVEGYYVAAYVGMVVYALAQLVFVIGVFTAKEQHATVAVVDLEDVEPDLELVLEGNVASGRIRTGAIALVVMAAVLVWLIPWAETSGEDATLLADESRRYRTVGDVADGREIYVQEGCWYCHTQQVRPIVADVGLGSASVVGDYVYETPVVFGVQRIGPDLMHVGSRPQTDDVDWVMAYLADPQEQRSYSIMPSYDHLSSSELADLAAYIVSSK